MSAETPRKAGVHRLATPEGQLYTLSVPSDFGGERPWPLVIALHYGGPVTPYYGEGLLVGVVEPALRRLEALIAAPDCNHGRWDNEESEAEVVALAGYLADHYPLDPSRTVLTGYSLGGIGAWHIGGRNQEQFAAVIPMAAGPPEETVVLEWHIPLFAIHGRLDELFPWQATAEAVNSLLERGASAELMLLDGVSHYETGRFMRPLQETIPWIRQAWGGN